MKWTRIIIAAVVVFFTFFCLDFVADNTILQDRYARTVGLWRPQAEQVRFMWAIELCTLVFCFFFCYLFTRSCRKGGVLEGLRFGVIVFFLVVPAYLFSLYFFLPVPFSLAVTWSIVELVKYLAAGVLTGALFRYPKPGSEEAAKADAS
jgi:hypothetical protein